MVLLFVYLLVALVFSFACSIMEAVLLSVNPSYIGLKEKEGSSIGKSLKEFKDNIDKPLAAILTLNTFAHTIGAAGVGVQAQELWGEESLTVVSIVLTLVILILSEIIPKTLGAIYWKSLAPVTVKFLKGLIFILYPLVYVSNLITKGLSNGEKSVLISRDEYEIITDMGHEEGIFTDAESKVIRNMLNFNNIRVEDIMTPRTVMLSVSEEISLDEFYERTDHIPFSRIPIYENNIDQITGFVLKDEILDSMISGKGKEKLKTLKRDVLTINKRKKLPELFKKLMESQEHLAIVIGEYGNTIGIVTMEDVIETLLGSEIMDELDNTEDLQELARKKWSIRAKKLGLLHEEDLNSEDEKK